MDHNAPQKDRKNRNNRIALLQKDRKKEYNGASESLYSLKDGATEQVVICLELQVSKE